MGRRPPTGPDADVAARERELLQRRQDQDQSDEGRGDVELEHVEPQSFDGVGGDDLAFAVAAGQSRILDGGGARACPAGVLAHAGRAGAGRVRVQVGAQDALGGAAADRSATDADAGRGAVGGEVVAAAGACERAGVSGNAAASRAMAVRTAMMGRTLRALLGDWGVSRLDRGDEKFAPASSCRRARGSARCVGPSPEDGPSPTQFHGVHIVRLARV